MGNILCAEHLKMKRTIIKKILIAAPIVTLLISFLAGSCFYSCAFNWWYTLFYPVLIAMICSQIQEKEKKKLNYQNIWSSPVSFHKIWWGKSLLAAGYSFLTCILLTILVMSVSFFFGVKLNVTCSVALLAGVVIFLTCCFQIPIYMILAKRFNFAVTCIVGMIFAALGIAFGEKSYWLFVPFTYCNRTMYRLLGIMINGLFLEPDKYYLAVSYITILEVVVISCVLFVLGTLVTYKIVERGVQKQ